MSKFITNKVFLWKVLLDDFILNRSPFLVDFDDKERPGQTKNLKMKNWKIYSNKIHVK